jgi:hypothetical protein
MTPAIRELFEYALRHVTAKDISDFCPGDPGYGDYVRAFNAILESSTLPKEADFDITETIGLTIWSKADDWPDPVRFRRFRTLTNAVGIALLVEDANGAEQNLRPNYLAIRSIEDAHALQDDALLGCSPLHSRTCSRARPRPWTSRKMFPSSCSANSSSRSGVFHPPQTFRASSKR